MQSFLSFSLHKNISSLYQGIQYQKNHKLKKTWNKFAIYVVTQLSLLERGHGLPFQLSIPDEKNSSSLWVNYLQDMNEEKTFLEAPRV